MIVFTIWMTIWFSFSFIYFKLTFTIIWDYLFVNSNLVWDSLKIPMNLGHWNFQYILVVSKRLEGLNFPPPKVVRCDDFFWNGGHQWDVGPWMIFGLQIIDTTKVGGMNILSLLTHNEMLLIQVSQIPIC